MQRAMWSRPEVAIEFNFASVEMRFTVAAVPSRWFCFLAAPFDVVRPSVAYPVNLGSQEH
eukprot:1599840-Lingulodinium_polyedra.AAC.1